MKKIRIITVTMLMLLLFSAGACTQTGAQEAAPAEGEISAEEEMTETAAETPETEEETPEAEETITQSSGEVIRLYYYGPSAMGVDPATLPGEHRIYSATSSDGTHFIEDAGVRFSYDTGMEFGITDADVVRLRDGSWLMFLSLGSQLLKATSPTTLDSFTLDESFSWNQGGVPGSFDFDGIIRTFVCYHNGIHMAMYNQNDGTLNYSGVAIMPPASGMIADPSVIRVGDRYLMFYKYAESPAAPPSEHEIYISTSSNGLDWTQHEENRFICKGSVPGAVYYKGTIYVYYCGLTYQPGSPPADLGLAVSRDNGITFTTSSVKIEGREATGVVDPAVIIINGQ